MIVAIDGPSGAGKSTVAKAVARELGFSCLDTGAMYRAVAWRAVQDGVPFDDDEALGAIARTQEIAFTHQPGEPLPSGVSIGGADVTAAIRTAEIDRAVSPVSAAPSVRAALLDQQRRIGRAGDYVVEGRDIGTTVFPEAEVKVFLTASDEERAHRRVRQNVDRGIGSIDYDEVLADLRARDERDSSRAASPLRPADDAVMLDSTGRFIEDIIDEICGMARDAAARSSR
ncbi:MAG TPA: (d)CMP kinase [Candidatus Aphodovivens avistercoris]|nr:(d)CMP kinase [Candidatus Aphodovivens avistercoris]